MSIRWLCVKIWTHKQHILLKSSLWIWPVTTKGTLWQEWHSILKTWMWTEKTTICFCSVLWSTNKHCSIHFLLFVTWSTLLKKNLSIQGSYSCKDHNGGLSWRGGGGMLLFAFWAAVEEIESTISDKQSKLDWFPSLFVCEFCSNPANRNKKQYETWDHWRGFFFMKMQFCCQLTSGFHAVIWWPVICYSGSWVTSTQ